MDVATGDGRKLLSEGRGVRDLPRTIYGQFVNEPGHSAACPPQREEVRERVEAAHDEQQEVVEEVEEAGVSAAAEVVRGQREKVRRKRRRWRRRWS